MLTEIIDNLNHERYARQGFVISCVGEDIYEVQRIDNAELWAEETGCDFVIPQLESDDQAKELAIAEGFLFEEVGSYFKVTGKK